MATQVGNVIFQISADLRQVQGQLGTLQRSFDNSFAGMTRGVKRFVTNFATTLGAGLGIAALVGFLKQTVSVIGGLNDLADQTGISAKTLSGLRVEILDAGSSVEQFSKGILYAQKSLGDMDGEGKRAAEALAAIGINAQEMVNASPDEFLQRVADGLAKIPNQAERAALAYRIFGRSGAELSNMLARIAPRIKELIESGLNEDTIKAMDEIATSFDRWKNAAMNAVAPGIAESFRVLSIVLESIKETLDEITFSSDKGFFGTLGQVLKVNIANAYELWAVLLRISKLSFKVSDFVSFGAFKSEIAALDQMIEKAQARAASIRGDYAGGVAGANIGGAQKVLPGKFQNLLKGEEKKESADALQKYIEKLKQEAQQLEINRAQETLTADKAAEVARAYELLALKAEYASSKKPVPPELEELAENARRTLQELGFSIVDLDKLSLSSLIEKIDELRSGVVKAKLDAEQLVKALEDADQAFLLPGERPEDFSLEGLGVGLQRNLGQMPAESLSSYVEQLKQWKQMVRDFEIDAMDTSTSEGARAQRLARVEEDFRRTAENIDRMGRELGMSQEDIAAAVEAAWKASLADINKETDELTKFQERAFERMYDAMSDLVKDALKGQIKSWEDLGNRIKDVLDDIVSEFLAMQLKIAILGPQYGQSGGQLGGLFGGILSILGGFMGLGSGSVGPAEVPGWMHGPGVTFGPGGGFSPVPLARQHGGPVDSGMPYIVGEKGPELFVPKAAGAILPTHETMRARDDWLSGQTHMKRTEENFSFNFYGVQDMDSFKRSRPQLMADLGRAVQRAKDYL